MIRKSFSTFVLGAAVTVTVAAQQSPIRPGNWEVTMQMEMPGMNVQMPEMKTTHCVTAEDLKRDPSSGLPMGMNDPKNPCKISDYKDVGGNISWKMTCSGAQPMTGSGEMVVKDDAYTGLIAMDSPRGVMTMKTTGKRLGACTP
jgi:hypothetical protein